MSYIAVMQHSKDGDVMLYEEFKLQEDAEAHAKEFRTKYPQAFVATKPDGGFRDWIADTMTGTLRFSSKKSTARAAAKTERELAEEKKQKAVQLVDILIQKGVVTEEDFQSL